MLTLKGATGFCLVWTSSSVLLGQNLVWALFPFLICVS